MYEVLIDMGNTNALVTVAMLAAIHENHQKDYLDIIKPFVCNLLPAGRQYVDLIEVKQRMESEYGFVNMPIGVLQKIMVRFCRDNPSICSDLGQNRFMMNRSYDNSDFCTKRLNIKTACTAVSEALKDYLNIERAMGTDVERCTSEFLRFLDQCGHRILNNNEAIRSLPVDERMGRYIACFIKNEKDKKSSIYDQILELARGYMVYRCIYFFSKSGIEKSNISLEDVVIYLDTPLIINALGYDTEIRRQAVWDAINLAKSLGARVTVLEHNVEEAQGILNAYIASYPKVQTFSLQTLTLKGYSPVTIRSISEHMPETIADSLGEDIDVAPGLGSSSDWDHINTEEALRKYYLDSIQGKEKDEVRRFRIENDVRTLSYAMQIRNGDRPQHFEDCKVIVLSDSKTARRATKALYDDVRHEEIDLVYSLNDFSCLAWLSSPSPSSDVAEDLLLYNAAAALDPSDGVIKQMLKYVDELAEAGEIGEEMAYVLRVHPSVKEATAEVVDTNTGTFTADMIHVIYEKALSGRANEIAASEYEPQVKGLRDELRNNVLQKQEMEAALRRERQKEANRFAKLDEEAHKKAAKWAKGIAKWLLKGFRVLQFLAIGFVVYSVIDGIKADLSVDNSVSIWEISAMIFTILSTIDYFIPKMHFADRWINKLANFLGDKIYTYEIKKGERYLKL